jgi:hypothetical protein
VHHHDKHLIDNAAFPLPAATPAVSTAAAKIHTEA